MEFIKKTAAVLISAVLATVAVLPHSAAAVTTSAKAHILINADTMEILDSSNAHMRLPMASTTKLMTSLLLAEQGDLEREVTVTEEMVTVEGSSMGLLPGDTVSRYELLVGMLLPSGNDAANTAAICVAGSVADFAEMMNRKAAELGMKNTSFATPSGLDKEEHYSTAYDMALLAAEVLKVPVLSDIVSKEKITVSFGAPPYQRVLYNHNKLLGSYKYCIGLKTGFTKRAGRCLVTAAERDGCRVIAVTLNAPDDWNDHKKLLEYGLDRLILKDVTAKLPSNRLSVVGGTCENVTIEVPKLSCGCTEQQIVAKLRLPPFVYAPIAAGQSVGTVEYYCGGRLIRTDSVTASETVDAKPYAPSFSEKFMAFIKNIIKGFC